MQNEFSLFIPQQLNDYERKGTFITVSACTGTLKRSLEIERQFKGIAENMEGAAVAHVCALNSIPLTEIRGISNIIGDRDAIPLPLTEIILAAGNAQRFFSDYFIP
jgi:futalosine hydrolase